MLTGVQAAGQVTPGSRLVFQVLSTVGPLGCGVNRAGRPSSATLADCSLLVWCCTLRSWSKAFLGPSIYLGGYS